MTFLAWGNLRTRLEFSLETIGSKGTQLSQHTGSGRQTLTVDAN